MMTRWLCWPVVVCFGCALSGCRCGPSEDELPATRAPAADASSPPAASGCGDRPAWAGASVSDDVEFEVLHSTKTAAGDHGSGYRLYTSGLFETYETVTVAPNDAGQMVLQRVEGSWSKRGPVQPEAIEQLRALVSENRQGLRGSHPAKKPSLAKTFIATRDGDQLLELCYTGSEPPPVAEKVQTKVHDLVNRVAK